MLEKIENSKKMQSNRHEETIIWWNQFKRRRGRKNKFINPKACLENKEKIRSRRDLKIKNIEEKGDGARNAG